MFLNKRTFYDVCFIFILAAIPFLRVGFKGIIHPLDSSFPSYPLDYFNKLSLWFETGAYFGNDGSYTSLAFRPFYFFPAILSSIGLSVNIINRITYIVFFGLLGISVYVMMNVLYSSKNNNACLLSAIFYMYNPFIMGYINLGHWYSLLSYAVFPLVVMSFIKGLDLNAEWYKWSLFISLLSIFIIPRVRIFSVIIQFISIYLLFEFIRNHSLDYIKHTLKFVLFTILITILMNMSWVLPSLINFESTYALLTTSPVITSNLIQYPSTYNDILNIFNLVGYGIPMNEYGLFYNNQIIRFISILLMIFIYSTLFKERKTSLLKFFIISSLIFNLYIITIIYIPKIMDVYLYLTNLVPTPLNLMFFPRHFQYTSIAVSLSYSFLIGANYEMLHKRITGIRTVIKLIFPKFTLSINLINLLSKSVTVLIIFIIIINSWPLFYGISSDKDFLEPIMIPSYYDESREWLLTQNPDFKIFSIPAPSWLTYYKHNWAFDGKYDITDILSQISPVPIITNKPKLGYSIGSDIVKLAQSHLFDVSGMRILELLGIKYLLIRNDVMHDEFNYNTSLENTYSLNKNIGELDFYRTSTYSPTVIATTNVIPIYGEINALIPISYIEKIKFNSTAFFFLEQMKEDDRMFLINSSKKILIYNDDIKDQNILKRISKSDVDIFYLFNSTFPTYINVVKDGLYNMITIDTITLQQQLKIIYLKNGSIIHPSHERTRSGSLITYLAPVNSSLVSYEQINLTTNKKSSELYQVNIQTETPCYIILNMAYHPRWKAYLNNQELRHLLSNSYSNCYYVSKGGTFSIKLQFSEISMYIIGLYISSICYFMGFMYLSGAYKFVLRHKLIMRFLKKNNNKNILLGIYQLFQKAFLLSHNLLRYIISL